MQGEKAAESRLHLKAAGLLALKAKVAELELEGLLGMEVMVVAGTVEFAAPGQGARRRRDSE